MSRFLDRDLSELAALGRQLALAGDITVPLGERMGILAGISAALDFFYEDRVSDLRRRAETDDEVRRVLAQVQTRVDMLVHQQDHLLHAVLVRRLAGAGVRVVGWADLDDHERGALTAEIQRSVLPSIGESVPLADAVTAPHLMPCLLVATSRRTSDAATVCLGDDVPRWFGLPGGRWISLDEVCVAGTAVLRAARGWVSALPFRVTRGGGLPVRLDVHPSMPVRARDRLARSLGLGRTDVVELPTLLDAGSLWALAALAPVGPSACVTASPLGEDVLGASAHDTVVHHPYESYNGTVLAMLQQAIGEPDVTRIRHMTGGSPAESVVDVLARAAHRGVRVDLVVGPNVDFGRVTPLLGVGGRVLESTVPVGGCATLVERGSRSCLRVGTSDQSTRLSRSEEGLSLFTTDAGLVSDVRAVFDAACDRDVISTSRVVCEPSTWRRRVLALIAAECVAPEKSRQIVLVVDELSDTEIIDALYQASADGVAIDIVVSGVCRLRPGVEGLSEMIRVRSLLGRHAQGSRIYVFGTGDRARWFIGSADLLEGDADDRVELVVPIDSERSRERLREIVATQLCDDVRAWELRSDGSWHRRTGPLAFDSELVLAEAAHGRVVRAPESN